MSTVDAMMYGCCKSDQGQRRHIIAPDWNLPLGHPPSADPLTSREVDVRISTKAVLDQVLSALHEEFQHVRRDQVQAEKLVQERMLTMDEKLSELLASSSKLAELTGGNSKLEGVSKHARGSVAVVKDEGDLIESIEGMAENIRKSRVQETKMSMRSGSVTATADSSTYAVKKNVSFSQREKERKSLMAANKDFAKLYSSTTRAVSSANGDVIEGVSCVSAMVKNPWFDMCMAVSIVLNAFLVGLQVNHSATSDDDLDAYTYAEYVFIAIFTLEFLLRMLAAGKEFCSSREGRFWASFDGCLVLLSWVDFCLMIVKGSGSLSGALASFAKILKLARMARIMRLLRVSKLLAKVRVMGTIIIGSMASLLWLFLLIAAIMYAFAILLTQGASDWLQSSDNDALKYELIKDAFGTVPRAMLTLFQSVTGGVNWSVPNDMAQTLGVLEAVVFKFFVFFFFFSVLNIVTGVYVDGAIQQANADRTLKEMKLSSEKQTYYGLLAETLAEIDKESHGFITLAEWSAAMDDSSVKMLMTLLEVDNSDADILFEVLDVDDDGFVSITEFVAGMQKLKGHAQSIHLHQVLCRVNFLIHQMRHWFAEKDRER